jgi:hypothetical protein
MTDRLVGKRHTTDAVRACRVISVRFRGYAQRSPWPGVASGYSWVTEFQFCKCFGRDRGVRLFSQTQRAA